ncbi:MAG: site-2 protease family protein [Clostridia bacterium]|nr:site-2 protease family protein [Clostridia bacterium]
MNKADSLKDDLLDMSTTTVDREVLNRNIGDRKTMFFKKCPILFLIIVAYILTSQVREFFYMLFFIFLHEIGHFVAGSLLGIKPLSFEVSVAGFRAELDTYKKSVIWKNLVVDCAGPFVNFVLVLIRNSD